MFFSGPDADDGRTFNGGHSFCSFVGGVWRTHTHLFVLFYKGTTLRDRLQTTLPKGKTPYLSVTPIRRLPV